MAFCILQDELYNQGGASGSFFVKVKNARQNINKGRPKSKPRPADQDEEQLIQYFKNCVISNERENLILKMKDTVSLRQNIIRQTSKQILECFNFYYADPTFVSYISQRLSRSVFLSNCLLFVLLCRYSSISS